MILEDFLGPYIYVFAVKSKVFDITFEEAVESWNDEAEGEENQIDDDQSRKIEKLAYEFFKREKWISINIIHAMIAQEGHVEETVINEPSPEELEKERIAQEKYEELRRKKTEEESRISAEMQSLREENQRLTREKEAAERAKEEQIVKMRQQATDQRNNQHMIQLNMIPKIPSLISKIKTLFRNRRIKSATNVGIKNYETAILERARIAVPKLLDDIEKMHEQLTILEDLLTKYSEVKRRTQEK